MILTVNSVGQENGNQTIKPIHSKNRAIYQLKSLTSLRELKRFMGLMIFLLEFQKQN